MYPPPQPDGIVPSHGQISADGRWAWNGITWVPWPGAASAYRSARARSRWAASLLGLGAFAALLLLVAEFGRLTLLNRILAGGLLTRAEADASDAFVRQAGIGVLVLLVAAGIAMLMWVHRIVANNYALGAKGLRFTPGWAVGWWFVPVASLVRPEQVVEESWRCADPGVRDSTPDSRRGLRAPMLVRFWWGAWILSALTAVAASAGSTATLAGLHDSTNAQLVSVAVRIVAAVLAVAVVLMLTARQEDKANAADTRSGVPRLQPFVAPAPPPLNPV
jgi:hypothetical protein